MIPPHIILCAVDFSDGSRVALSAAARCAVQFDAELHVLHVEDPLLSAAAAREGFDLRAETLDELRRFVDSTPPAAACEPQLHDAPGAAAPLILRTAAELRADLVVLGRSGLTGVELVVFGSTAQNVVRRAAVSLLLVPPRWAPPRVDTDTLAGMGPVVVGVDPGPPAERTVTAAASLATTLRTSLEIVHIVPAPRLLARWQRRAEATLEEAIASAHRTVSELASRAAPAIKADVKVESGDVPERLAAAAARDGNRQPLLVLGRKEGEGGSTPGTIAYRVIALSDAPVFVHA